MTMVTVLKFMCWIFEFSVSLPSEMQFVGLWLQAWSNTQLRYTFWTPEICFRSFF